MRHNQQMVRAGLLLAAVLLLTSSGAAYSRSQAHPTTIVTAKGPIAAFAQDGNKIAWASINNHAACPWQVRIRLLGPKKQKIVNNAAGPTCHSDTGFDPSHKTYLALAGKRALWTLFDSGNSTYIRLVTASYAAGADTQLEELVYSNGFGDGDHLGGMAGDASTLVYGVANVGITGPPDCDIDGTCTPVISGGSVKRVVGAGTVSVAGAPAPAMLAAAGNRVAYVVAETATTSTVGPGSPATVTVENALSGAHIGSFAPLAEPLAIAFAPAVVAVLESTGGGRQIEFWTPAGVLQRTVAVPAAATDISTTNKRAVFRVGKSIRTVRVAGGGVKKVATAAKVPIGLSIEGTRVAWAENVKIHGSERGRIRKITVR
jgi:hypothetical protein